MTNKNPPVKYINRDFETIKQDLINYAKVYYPDTFKDFNEASFGALMLDLVAYTGDMLSFYSDYQTNESFLDSAIETKNIIKLAKQFGFKYPGTPSSSGVVTLFVIVPATSAGSGPNTSLIPILQRGTSLVSDSGASFSLNDDVDFSKTDVETVVSAVNADGQPTSYALKAFGEVISGRVDTELVTVGAYEKFMRLQLTGENITEILTVHDSQGHEYFEVDYLSQNIIFQSIRNRVSTEKELVPYLLREILVPRRFVVEHNSDFETFLQFGYGSEETLKDNSFPDPSTSVLQVHAKKYFKDASFDPNIMLKTDKFGVVPPQGQLIIRYRVNTNSSVNIAAGSLNRVTSPIFSFGTNTVSATQRSQIASSIEVTNETPILGQTDIITSEEIRTRAIDNFSSQNRAVTKQDYLNIIYRMPAKFGSIKRANIVQDKDSFKRNLNLFVVSENIDGNLIEATSTLKNNLKKWINQYKMINDTIDILDGRIANIGIEFEVVGVLEKSTTEILNKSISAIKAKFANVLFLGQPFYVQDVFKALNDLPEVIDTKSVKIVNRRGSKYSTTNYDAEANMTSDQKFIIVPEDVILELRFPDEDIVGVVS